MTSTLPTTKSLNCEGDLFRPLTPDILYPSSRGTLRTRPEEPQSNPSALDARAYDTRNRGLRRHRHTSCIPFGLAFTNEAPSWHRGRCNKRCSWGISCARKRMHPQTRITASARRLFPCPHSYHGQRPASAFASSTSAELHALQTTQRRPPSSFHPRCRCCHTTVLE